MSFLLAVLMVASGSNQLSGYDSYVYLMLYRTEARMYIMDGVHGEIRQGYINRHGDFVSEKVLVNSSKSDQEQSKFWGDVYNGAWLVDELLYEYRFGMLIPGKIGPNRQFIPSKDPIITLDEYLELVNHYKVDLISVFTKPESFPAINPKATNPTIDPGNGAKSIVLRRIYNLPGIFVRKSKYEEEKKRLFKLPFNVESNQPVKK